MSQVEAFIPEEELSGDDRKRRRKWKIVGALGGVVVATLIVIISLSVGLRDGRDNTGDTTRRVILNVLPDDRRVDCYPEASSPQEAVDREGCEARGCVWSPSSITPAAPACYYPEDGDSTGLRVLEEDDLQDGKRWTLLVKSGSRLFASNITKVRFTVKELSDNILNFKFEDDDDLDRYQVPLSLTEPDVPAHSQRYSYSVTRDPFSFKLTRKDTSAVLWDTSVGGLLFTDQLLQISTLLPTKNVFGFGENVHMNFRHDMNFRSWPLFARDQPPGYNENPLYSVHPFYECVEDDGKAHGVFLMNSNAMEYAFTPAPMLTYRTIGGILDFYIMMGPSPENVIHQYTGLIGRPYMPPYWALGFQLSRYGYRNTEDMRAAINRTLSYDIPIDVQHADIDHMEGARDFTLDMTHFSDLPDYFKELRAAGIKTIIILDPCFEINSTYVPYLRGREADIYVKWPSRDVMPPGDYEEYNRTDMMGYVWPNWKTVFPDFFNSKTSAVWSDLITEHWQTLNFDGIWIDMNEPANFDTNNEKAWNWIHGPPYWTLKCPISIWDDPPYRPKAVHYFDNDEKRVRVADKTLCMQAVLGDNGTLRHYDVHSLYGHVQLHATVSALRNAVPNKRGMVVTRSTYAGSGKYAGRWLGDNNSAWKDMRLSIIGILEFNLFGIPYIGADICGFFSDCPAELCKRWMQLGAFYTFSRNHNHKEAIAQDPGYYGEEVASASREALRTRYRLLPYLYTLFHKAHVHGHTVIRPLFHEFSHDAVALGVDQQFLWGPALLISPILHEMQTELKLYMPGGRWYDYYTGALISERAGTQTLQVTSDSPIPLYVRGGYILPMQEPANNTRYSRQNNFGLKVALDKLDGTAVGDIFWDGGESIDTFESGAYFSAYFSSQENTLDMHITHTTSEVSAAMGGLLLDEVQVLGVSVGGYVYVNGQSHTRFTFDSATNVLNITGLGLPLTADFSIKWSSHPVVTVPDYGRVDCCPEGGCDVNSCTTKRCLWAESDADSVPSCYIDSSSYGYDVEGYNPGILKEGNVSLVRRTVTSLYGGDVNHIVMSVTQSERALRIKIYDPENVRYEVPVGSQLNLPAGDSGLSVSIQETPFSFNITRDSDSAVLWDSAVGGLTFADQFLQIAARIHCRTMQGFGEHVHPHLSYTFTYKTWPMFARDQPPGPNGNLYSVHPFYMCIEESGTSHGVLLLNSNAMEVSTMPDPGVIFRTTGGILDLIVVNSEGGDPTQMLASYVSIIGKPFLPPYWALGFHLSRYGYDTMDNLRAVVERNIEAGLPYDVQHLDIDTMDERKDFTIDPINFKRLPEFVTEIRNKGIKTLTILDPFLVSNYSDYEPYNRGMSQDVYMKWPEGVNPDYDEFQTDVLLGWCWPKGRVVFPDFFHPNTSDFWQNLITYFYTNGMTFDGIWLDMGEPANFGTNEDRAFNWPEKDTPYWTLKCPISTWDDPPYKPKSIWGNRLSDKTICMNTLQAQGRYRHYDVHNIYGWSQTQPTLLGVQKATNRRGLVVARSTYPSSGRYAGHWLGDNGSQWSGLKDSVIGIMEFNMFGIPFVGADICGYFNDAPADLCQRWHQLGAFYPFARNHQGKGTQPQDPAYYGGEMLASTRRVLETRYNLLPYLYTLFFRAHITGAPVVSALSHVFNMDKVAASVDRQFMWGSHLLISPMMEQNKDMLWAYFPTSVDRTTLWYDYYNGMVLDGGRYHELAVPMDILPLHVRENSVIFTQDPATNTQLSRMNQFGLLVTPNLQQSFYFYWDDGDSIDTVENGEYFEASCNATSALKIKYTIVKDHASIEGARLGHIKWYGMSGTPDIVTVTKGNAQPGGHSNFRFYRQSQMLIIQELDINMRESFEIDVELKQRR